VELAPCVRAQAKMGGVSPHLNESIKGMEAAQHAALALMVNCGRRRR
jgi:hypothetical protein